MCIGPRKKNGPRGKEREGFGAFGLETSVESVVCFFFSSFLFQSLFQDNLKAIFKTILKITLNYFLTLVKPLSTINKMQEHECIKMLLHPMINFN